MDEFSELEKKVYDALIDNKQNEVSEKVHWIESMLSQSRADSVSLPDSNEMLDRYQKLNQQKIIKINWARNMNKKIIFTLGAAAVVLIGLFLGLRNGDTPKNQVTSNEIKVKITFVIGDVKLKSETNAVGVKPEVGALLSNGDTLITGEKSTIDLEFSHGSNLRIKSNTEIAIKRLIENNGTLTEEVSLKKGMLVANVTKKKQSDNFNIVTPTVIAGVRGTRFLVEVIPNSSNLSVTRVSVLDGSVGITKHKDEIPVSAEPIEILDGKQTAIEMASGGEFKKSTINDIDTKTIEGSKGEEDSNAPGTVSETEESLYAKYGRLEVLSLDGGSAVTGVITAMDDKYLTVHTVKGFVKVDRKQIISHDAKQLK
ncbi:MAG: FecR domain-containing protein [Leptospiraceae bacterium]|nr:FecR domain-containing protein [Leptospiraceae bacterium]